MPQQRPGTNPVKNKEAPLTKIQPPQNYQTCKTSYADIASRSNNKSTPTKNVLDITKVLVLLQDLLSVFATNENPKDMMTKIINSFIALFTSNNE